MDIFHLYAKKFEMDRAVFYAILSRFWSLAAGPATALLIAYKFSPEIQGYYYTFASLLALQTFAELGIGLAITQFASHEWSKLRIGDTNRIEGDPDALSRLASVARVAVKWYGYGGLLVFAGLSAAGYVFFQQTPSENIHWEWPWFSLCLATGMIFFSTALWSLLEGCNQVANVYMFRFVKGILSSVTLWAAIMLGAGLWTPSLMSLAVLAYTGFFLCSRYRTFLASLFALQLTGPRITWRADIYPFQWRLALSWLAGYFAFNLFTPVLFHYHGPVLAGQMGMTWALCGVVSSLASAWLSPRVPQFGIYVAQRRYAEMDRLLIKLTLIVTLVTFISGAGVWILVYGVNYFELKIAARVLPPLPTFLFMLAILMNTITMPMSTYLRAHKKEPLMILSVVFGLLVGLSTWIMGMHYADIGVSAGYFIITALVVPRVYFIWKRCRNEWHN